jgi:hypothetical protein
MCEDWLKNRCVLACGTLGAVLYSTSRVTVAQSWTS